MKITRLAGFALALALTALPAVACGVPTEPAALATASGEIRGTTILYPVNPDGGGGGSGNGSTLQPFVYTPGQGYFTTRTVDYKEPWRENGNGAWIVYSTSGHICRLWDDDVYYALQPGDQLTCEWTAG